MVVKRNCIHFQHVAKIEFLIDYRDKKYGKAEVLNIPSKEIPTGESFNLVGNNGEGKTTFFNILLDLIRQNSKKK